MDDRDLSEFVRMAKVEAAIDANNLLHYNNNLDSALTIAATSSRHNVDVGVTKQFIKRIKREGNWRLVDAN